MANQNLQGTKVAILVTNGFEQSELLEPRKALDGWCNHKVVSPAENKVKGWNMKEWGNEVPVDVPLRSAKAEDFDALLLPGGVMNPDHLRMNPQAVDFVKRFTDAGKPVAAICHGPWTLIEAGAVRGHTMTSWPSLQTDLKNAGANWVDTQVVRDGKLVTSRKPDDIPAFNREMIQMFAETSSQNTSENAGTECAIVLQCRLVLTMRGRTLPRPPHGYFRYHCFTCSNGANRCWTVGDLHILSARSAKSFNGCASRISRRCRSLSGAEPSG